MNHPESSTAVATHTLIIASNPRSGSNLLCAHLANTGITGPVPECCTEQGAIMAKRRLRIPLDAGWLQMFQQLRSNSGTNLFAFKVMYPDWARVIDQSTADPAAWIHFNFPNLTVVTIFRDDIQKQAISYALAMQSDCWVDENEKGLSQITKNENVFDYLLIRKLEKELIYNQQQTLNFWNNLGIEPLQITYESFVKDPTHTISEIVRKIGINPPPPSTENVQFKQQKNPIKSSWEEQYISIRILATADCNPHNPLSIAGHNLASLRIHTTEGTFSPFTHYCLQASVTNLSQQHWPLTGDTDDRYLIFVTADWIDEWGNLYEAGQNILPHQLAPGESCKLILPITTPHQPGKYTLQSRVVQYNASLHKVSISPTVQNDYIIERPLSWLKLEAIIGDLKKTSLKYLSSYWLGEIYADQFPWIYHQQHGWLFCDPQKNPEGKVCLHDPHLGPIFTSPDDFPWFFIWNSNEWRCHLDGSWEPRLFIDKENNSVIRLAHLTEQMPFQGPGAYKVEKLASWI